MSIHVALHHATRYTYDRRVQMGPQIVRLRPAPHCRTPILSYTLKVEPAGHFINWQQDPHGNYQARIVYPEPVTEFSVEVDLVADMSVQNPFDFFLEPDAEELPFTYDPVLKQDLEAFLDPETAGPLLRKWLDSLPPFEGRTIDYLVAINERLQQDIEYLVRMEPGVQTCDETLARAKGSCRDTGWLLVQIFRHLGLGARFVSGYLLQIKPDVKSLDGPSGADHDFTDLHAWAEVYLPGAGWIGFDPTSGLLTGEGHIPLAATPRPQSAAPISGTMGECEVTFAFDMEVTRVFESPRVTLPYSDDQWQAIDRLGNQIDTVLDENDVRLTQGGEPTFVSIDDVDAAEWNTAAVGPKKRGLADQLIRRLRDRYAPGGMLHYGQGKWYPGEPLPRWSFAPGRPILEAAVDLTSRIFRDFKYEGGVTDIYTPVDQVLFDKHGVCQDFAHLQIACLRGLNLPARYVSGYLMTHPPAGQKKLIGADESHAWLSIWIPNHGWVDLDPTNNLIPSDEHITVAWGRDYGDVSPINGLVLGGGEQVVKVSVDVRPVARESTVPLYQTGESTP